MILLLKCATNILLAIKLFHVWTPSASRAGLNKGGTRREFSLWGPQIYKMSKHKKDLKKGEKKKKKKECEKKYEVESCLFLNVKSQ